jgi:molybdopterin molybdotransferase
VDRLISIADARRRVLAAVRPLGAESVELGRALGRVLAEEVRSPLDVPPFANSAMDGFAVVAGPAGRRRLVGESRAGRPTAERVDARSAVRISTGAALPEGATAVVPLERSRDAGAGVVELEASRVGDNIRAAGEDTPAGAVVLTAGTVLGPAELGVAAAVGHTALDCSLRPRLGLVVTGDELVEPGLALGPGQIHSSNGFALAAQAELAGALVRVGHAVDDGAETRAALESALNGADVVCVSGGVSVGPHDHVKAALRELGAEEIFWGVSLRPGKPTWFGVRGGTPVFGLPGNPASAMVTFQLFARPALAALQGADPEARRARGLLDEPLARHPIREQAVRVRLRAGERGWHAAPTGAQGSHRLTSMLGAQALALIPPGEGVLEPGAAVELELL